MIDTTDSVLVAADGLRSYLLRLFVGYGATEENATETAGHLVEASLTGHDSHGALRAPSYIERIEAGNLDPKAVPTVVVDGPTTAVIDGGWGFGQPASRLAMRVAIDKAKALGISCVTVRNANHMGGVVAHKGFALSLAIEGLAGALSGAGCSNQELKKHGNACWYTVIRIDAFTPIDDFKKNVGKSIDHVKSARRIPGIDEILYPGQPEALCRLERLQGGIPVDLQTWDRLNQMATRVELPHHRPYLRAYNSNFTGYPLTETVP